jgi:hypothetical protein
MTTTTLHKPPAYVSETPQDTSILVLLASLGVALLVVATIAVLFVLTLPALSIGG